MRANLQDKIFEIKGFSELCFTSTLGARDGKIIVKTNEGETVIFSVAGENLACIHKRVLDLTRQIEDYMHDEFAIKYTKWLERK